MDNQRKPYLWAQLISAGIALMALAVLNMLVFMLVEFFTIGGLFMTLGVALTAGGLIGFFQTRRPAEGSARENPATINDPRV